MKKKKGLFYIAGFYIVVIMMLFYYADAKKQTFILDTEQALIGLSGEFEKEEESERIIESEEIRKEETIKETESEKESKERKKYVFVTTNKRTVLYVRSAPSMLGRIIGRLAPASRGEVLEQGEEWSLITDGEVEGFSNNRYLDIREKE